MQQKHVDVKHALSYFKKYLQQQGLYPENKKNVLIHFKKYLQLSNANKLFKRKRYVYYILKDIYNAQV